MTTAARPLANRFYLDTSKPGDGRSLTGVLSKLDEEIRLQIFEVKMGTGYRELSFILGKIEEAHMWAIRYGELIGTHAVIDKRDYPDEMGNA